MAEVVRFVDTGIKIAQDIQTKSGSKTAKAFAEELAKGHDGITALKEEVTQYARQFPTIGFTETDMRYKM
jgi:glycine hydroxymethyltransferase